MPCVSSGECLEKGLAAPGAAMENRLEPMPEEGGTLNSEPSGRFRMLVWLTLALLGDASVDWLDSDGAPPPFPPLLLPMLEVGM